MPLDQNPPYRLSGFSGHPDTLSEMVRAAQSVRGEQSMLVRGQVEDIVRELQGKDYLGEILAVRYWVTEYIRYLNDPLHVELIKDPQRLVEEVLAYGKANADCDEMATIIGTMGLCLGREADFVVAGFGSPGEYSHVFARIKEPRSGDWIICDPVAGTDETGMRDRITTYYTVSLDEPPEAALSGFMAPMVRRAA